MSTDPSGGARPGPAFESLLAAETDAGGAGATEREKPARSAAEAFAAAARRRRLSQIAGGALALVGVAVGGSLAWSRFGPITAPDTFSDPFDDVLGFALLDKDFNRLPIERRLELLREMSERLRGLDSGDSALMAAFAAGISGKAREQLEANMQRLMTDVVDTFALRYAQAPESEKEEALEESILGMIGLMQELNPLEEGAGDPKETLDRIKRQAARNQERAGRNPAGSQVGAADVGRMFDRVQGEINAGSSPAQRARTTRFMRDTVRYMRGQDIGTGKPK